MEEKRKKMQGSSRKAGGRSAGLDLEDARQYVIVLVTRRHYVIAAGRLGII